MENNQAGNKEIDISIDNIKSLTKNQSRQLKVIEFAGFLIKEDRDTLYIEDAQGTWVVSRDDISFIQDWDPQNLQNYISDGKSRAKPIRIGVKSGATIYEIRPWLINPGKSKIGGGIEKDLEKVFTLGRDPDTQEKDTLIGESKLIDLERILSRRLGYSVYDENLNTRSRRSSTSGTWVFVNGYCDQDADF